jgi:hypothetical protein
MFISATPFELAVNRPKRCVTSVSKGKENEVFPCWADGHRHYRKNLYFLQAIQTIYLQGFQPF